MPRSLGGRAVSVPATTLAVLMLAALLLRLPVIGDPLFDIDEQFYLLVGDRLLHGALPYVDIWDRKPVGLFLIYAAIRLLGGDGVVQYQVVAMLSAVATAAIIATIGRRFTRAIAATGGGLVYLVWLNFLGGGGGQSPVFYNLLTALAALATLAAVDDRDPARVRRRGDLAMLAMGLALQIKTTVLFEGCLFGATFLWLEWTRSRRAGAVAALALRLMAIALAPTLVVFAFYVAIGEGSAFWFANVASILLRQTPPDAQPGVKLGGILLVLAPIAAAALAGVARRWRDGGGGLRLLAAWLGVAAAGFLAVAPYYNHYALPLLVPISVAVALAMDRGMLWRAAVVTAAAALLILTGYPDIGRAQAARERLATLESLIVPHLRGGCLFVFQGPPILYQASHACTLSRYVFPAHLNYLGEARAIGVDPAAEVTRILTARPTVIVTSRRAAIVDPNPATWPIVEAALRRDYRLVGVGRADYRMLGVYALKAR